ncbi:hydroxyacid dehydrogenase [Acidihalobacter yilgarnensis]|uniref:Hydroxyacid dehydrogenase n=1 Tax=Acidihalobacter yilgarnensis TaxID=2819280 RepID=A0A1D8IS47_9GAMM|nr:NAD(P)-dependent oxidoreductase [Acidihalobacter yilgarnensis]AOU99322.1 hydroxyacid dehydrogenase [Acidihalobacter yilgarnensis]
MHIALLGTGLMGAPLAQRLAERGHALSVWNRTPERAMALQGDGIEVCAEASAAVAGADVAVLTLSDAAAIDAVLAGSGVLSALNGRVLVQMGTISPAQSRVLAARLAEVGIDYLEAPLLGSRPEAAKGTLLVMAGGSPETFARCLPWLRDCGPEPILVGPVGQASALKLALNQLIAGLTSGFALSLGLVRREGVPVETFMAILRESALYASTFDKKLDRMCSGDYSGPNFPLKHLLKDVVLCREVAEADGLNAGVLDAIAKLLGDGMAAGHAEDDYSALTAMIDPQEV